MRRRTVHQAASIFVVQNVRVDRTVRPKLLNECQRVLGGRCVQIRRDGCLEEQDDSAVPYVLAVLWQGRVEDITGPRSGNTGYAT